MNVETEKILKQKKANLRDLLVILSDANINYWLSGRTLLYASKVSCLNADASDVLGLLASSWPINEQIAHQLSQRGFSLVIKTSWEIVFSRAGNSIKLELYRNTKKGMVYRELTLPANAFDQTEKATLDGIPVIVPVKVDDILTKIFAPGKSVKVWRIVKSIVYNRSGLFQYFKNSIIETIEKLPPGIQNVIYKITGSRRKVVKLSEQEFLRTVFEDDPYNWIIRKKHLDLVTDHGKHMTIGEIMAYLKDGNNLQKLKQEIHETPVKQLFFQPMNFSIKFWNLGNNFFINCILYSFRRNVISYEQINSCIHLYPEINIFSAGYYQTHEPMNDKEIRKVLKMSPIKIANGSFKSGRHRICAMMGRLLNNESYLPIYAILLD